ncbi:MAG: isochorismatase family protein [Solirubrobacterales bacterium]
MSAAKLDRERAALIVVDVQDAFRKAVPDFERVALAASTLVQGAEELELPIVVTEQYPQGLGDTVPEVREILPEDLEPLEKVVFSAAEADGFDLGGREQALVCGIETHVCVNQTVLDLLDRGVEVHVAENAVGSRFDSDKRVGLEKMERAGAVLTSVETALFELVGRAGTDEFKAVQKLILRFAPNPGATARKTPA